MEVSTKANPVADRERPAVLSESLGVKVGSSPVLMVGAGGIGCELLKNLVLSGFKNITIIDLDTIDVTNLNRQFLFHREHVGRSKAEVARESAISFVPDANITALHKSVTTNEFAVDFYKKFDLVLNALDNRAARSHVNKMCLAADVPLIESGTSGYLGQVTGIRKGKTECYDCQTKPHQKTFPGCTIRNTPSEPIHCIVWSKHLFNQLFGEADADKDVSPDSEDPELKQKESEEKPKEDGDKKPEEKMPGEEKVRTREWAQKNEYDPQTVFRKLFYDDIQVLLKMEDLWEKRTKPTPLDWDEIVEDKVVTGDNAGGIKDQKMWSLKKCRDVFAESVTKLKDRLKAKDYKDDLVWDKDDEAAMDFVVACANIRAHIFEISKKSRFDVKSMAGNIIPAIATTNAIIAGCIVMEALKILNDEASRMKNVFLRKTVSARKQILVTENPVAPNPKCRACANEPQVDVRLDLDKVTLKTFEATVLKKELNMVMPDAERDDGTIIITNEEGNCTAPDLMEKTLREMKLTNGSILTCEDFLQDYKIKVILYHSTDLPQGVECQVDADVNALIEAEKEKKKLEEGQKEEDDDIEMIEEGAKENVSEKQSETKGKENTQMMNVKENGTEAQPENKPEDDNSKKRQLDENSNGHLAKKAKNEGTINATAASES